MDNEQNKSLSPENGSDWLDEVFGAMESGDELGPDILAITSARLTHPDDVELEKILAEDWDSVPDPEEPPIFSHQEDPDRTQILPEEDNADKTTVFSVPEDTDATMVFTNSEDGGNSHLIPEELEDTNETVVFSGSKAAEDDPGADPEMQFSAEDIIAEFSDNNKNGEEGAENGQAADTMFFAPVTENQETNNSEPAPEKEAAPQNVRIRKIRPAPKKGYGLLGIPHILVTFVWLAIILLIGLTLGHSLWSGITDLMAFGKPDQQITITITDSEVLELPDGSKVVNVDAIANKLKDSGLISNPQWFILFASTLTDKANDIDPGTYTLNTKFDYNAMINNMQRLESAREEVEILIPEGYTCAQIFSLLEEKDVCTVEEMETYLDEICQPDDDGIYPLSDYWFLEDTPRNRTYWLEGYLFPDTYRFYVDDDPENVIKKFLDGFDFRFTDVMRGKLETIEERTGLDLSIHEVIIIASMIEKETAGTSDSYLISSVIYNRLSDDEPWYLNIDATIYYALGGNIDPATGLPKPLTKEDMELDHPFNTYKYTGLPPGAISNPGRNSLDAALTPEQDGIEFYLFRGSAPELIPADTDKKYELLYYVYSPVDEVHIYSLDYDNQVRAEEYIKSLE